jgi:hypothetical protein
VIADREARLARAAEGEQRGAAAQPVTERRDGKRGSDRIAGPDGERHVSGAAVRVRKEIHEPRIGRGRGEGRDGTVEASRLLQTLQAVAAAVLDRELGEKGPRRDRFLVELEELAQHDAARGADRRGEARVVGRVGLGEDGVERDRLCAVRCELLDQLREPAPGPRPAAVAREAPLVDADDGDHVARRPPPTDLEAQIERFQIEGLERPRRPEAQRSDSEPECHADADDAEALGQTAEESHAMSGGAGRHLVP